MDLLSILENQNRPDQAKALAGTSEAGGPQATPKSIEEALEKRGMDTRVQTAIPMPSVAEPFMSLRAIRHLEKGRTVIFAGGTGNPYFSTDTAAALRATEGACDVLMMAKNKTDGVYDRDPNRFADAIRFVRLTHDEVFQRQLGVMDRTALTLSMENLLPILAFDIAVPGNMARAVIGDEIGTMIGRDDRQPRDAS